MRVKDEGALCILFLDNYLKFQKFILCVFLVLLLFL